MARLPQVIADGTLNFGECLWHGAVGSVGAAPWTGTGLQNFGVVTLGPAVAGRAPVLLVLGGRSSSSFRNDVWRSMDGGLTWEAVSPHDEGQAASNGRVVRKKWAGRESFAAASGCLVEGGNLKGLVYVIGGIGSARQPYSDVWVSEDLGKSFMCMCADAPFGRRLNSGLATCPGAPEKLCLVGGGWTTGPTYWDCWLSVDGGFQWCEVGTPDNAVQRHCPVLIFPRPGTLLVLGGRWRDEPVLDAHAAKIGWTSKSAAWHKLQVRVYCDSEEKGTFLDEDGTLIDEVPATSLPWFLSHTTVFDKARSEFTGVVIGNRLAIASLPPKLLLGPLKRTLPGEEAMQIYVSIYATRQTDASGIVGQDTCEDEEDEQLQMKRWACARISNAHCMGVKAPKRPELESFHFILPDDAARLFIFSKAGAWSTYGGLRRQARLLQRIARQAHIQHGLVPEIWDRVLLLLFGDQRLRPELRRGDDPNANLRAACPQAQRSDMNATGRPRPSAAYTGTVDSEYINELFRRRWEQFRLSPSQAGPVYW